MKEKPLRSIRRHLTILPLVGAIALVLQLVACNSGSTSGSGSGSASATLIWDANAEPTVVGYRVYFGTSSGRYQQTRGAGIDVRGATRYTVAGLANGTRYFFAVTAFDASGNESPYSNEAFKDLP